ncbi:Ionotropic receptor 749 [Blattella germanica]|nr:Ionotropic receptor 749 [Blattella germanica]
MSVLKNAFLVIILVQLQFQSNESLLRHPSGTERSVEKHLTDCLVSILKSHYPKMPPISVQTPISWLKFFRRIKSHNLLDLYGENVLQSLHNNFVPHRSISSEGDSSLVKKTSKVTEVHVLLLSGSTKWVQFSLARSMIQRITEEMHNPKARVIFATGTAPDTVLEQKLTAMKLMQMAWSNARFADAIVLMPDLISSSSVEFNVFGWQLRDQKDECLREVTRAKLLDRWSSDEEKFLKGVELFPPKLMKHMNQCEINAFLIQMPPMHRSSRKGVIAGPYFKVFCLLEELLNVELFIQGNTNMETDFVFPVLYGNGDSQSDCRRTYPYLKDDVTWLVPGPVQVPQWQSLVRIFNPTMWLPVTVVFVLGLVTFWVIENTDQNRNKLSFVQLALNTLCTYLAIGITYKHFKLLPLLFFALWLMYCLQIYTAYQSALIGFLLNPGYIPPIRSYSELTQSGLERLAMISAVGLDESQAQSYAYRRCPSTIFCLRRTIDERDAAILYYRSVTQITSLTREINIVPIEDNVDTVYLSIYSLSGGCILHGYLETLLGRLFDSGILHMWTQDTLQEAISTLRALQINVKNVVLTLSHLQGAFFLFVLGSIISCIAFLVEILLKHNRGMQFYEQYCKDIVKAFREKTWGSIKISKCKIINCKHQKK